MLYNNYFTTWKTPDFPSQCDRIESASVISYAESMKKVLAIVVLGLLLVGCASSTINYVGFDEIKKIEAKNYIIVGFSGYQRDTDTIHKINEANYTSIEKSINRK